MKRVSSSELIHQRSKLNSLSASDAKKAAIDAKKAADKIKKGQLVCQSLLNYTEKDLNKLLLPKLQEYAVSCGIDPSYKTKEKLAKLIRAKVLSFEKARLMALEHVEKSLKTPGYPMPVDVYKMIERDSRPELLSKPTTAKKTSTRRKGGARSPRRR